MDFDPRTLPIVRPQGGAERHHLPGHRRRFDVVRFDGRRRGGAEILLALGASAAFLGTTGGAIAIAAVNVAISLAVSFALNFVMGALAKRPRQPDIKRELAQPNSLPPYRFVYGTGLAYGTPWPIRHPDPADSASPDDELVGCLLFNSRPSEGNFTIEVDDREVTYTGDPYDFAGDGAEVTGPGLLSGHLRFWIGKGAQTAPPTWMTTNYGNTFTSGDKYRTRTVLWFHLDRGASEELVERWPNWPPVFRLVGDWSLLWDPNDVAQSLDDPSTWTFSANRARAVLDALTQNPLRPYPLASIHLASFKAAAAVDDEDVPLKAGGTEKRHRVSGVIVWDGREVHEQVEPLVMAGGAVTDLVRIGGKLGLVPGDLPESAATITDVLMDDGFDYATLKPGRDLASRVSCAYVEPSHDWEMADLPVYEVPGAVVADGGLPTVEPLELGFVPSHAQAARLQKRHAYRLREQRRFRGTLPPAAFDLVSGSGLTLALPAPLTRMNRLYQVRAIRPRLIEREAGGVVLRCPVELVEVHAGAYDWDAATEEPDVPAGPTVETTPSTTAAPASLMVTPTYVSSGASTVVGARLEWPPVTAQVFDYEVQFRESGGDWGAWARVGSAVRDASGDVFTEVYPLVAAIDYDFRVRANRGGRVSDWTEALNQTITAPGNALSAPSSGSAAANGQTEILVTFTLPNDQRARGIQFYGGDSADTGLMTTLGAIKWRSPGEVVTHTETGLSASRTRYYAATTVDEFEGESALSAVVNATTDGLATLYSGGTRAGFIYEPWDAATLTLSGSAITAIADKSGNAVDASQATGTKQPTSSGDWISCDGTSDLLAVDIPSGERTASMSLFMVVQTTDLSFMLLGTRGGTAYAGFGQNGSASTAIGNASGTPTFWVNGVQHTTLDAFRDAIATGVPVIVEARTLDMTGVAWAEAQFPGFSDTAGSTAGTLLAGSIGTVMLIDAPTSDERDQIMAALAHKYGVTL